MTIIIRQLYDLLDDNRYFLPELQLNDADNLDKYLFLGYKGTKEGLLNWQNARIKRQPSEPKITYYGISNEDNSPIEYKKEIWQMYLRLDKIRKHLKSLNILEKDEYAQENYYDYCLFQLVNETVRIIDKYKKGIFIYTSNYQKELATNLQKFGLWYREQLLVTNGSK